MDKTLKAIWKFFTIYDNDESRFSCNL